MSSRPRARRRFVAGAAALTAVGLLGSGVVAGAASAAPAAPAPGVSKAATANPLAGARFYRSPDTDANRAKVATKDKARKAAFRKIAQVPTAQWLGGFSINARKQVRTTMVAAKQSKTVPVFTVYGLPELGAGKKFPTVASYQSWVNTMLKGYTGVTKVKAVFVLEPTAISGAMGSTPQYRQALTWATARFAQLKSKGITTYVDAGGSDWLSQADTAARLKAIGVSRVRGVAVNVGGYQSNANQISWARGLAKLVPGIHVVVDTSRNGRPAAAGLTPCNLPTAGLGAKPRAMRDAVVDAFLWIKPPGQSDGKCNGGPAAGVWWPKGAYQLARNAAW